MRRGVFAHSLERGEGLIELQREPAQLLGGSSANDEKP